MKNYVWLIDLVDKEINCINHKIVFRLFEFKYSSYLMVNSYLSLLPIDLLVQMISLTALAENICSKGREHNYFRKTYSVDSDLSGG